MSVIDLRLIENLLTVKDVAQMLGVSPKTVYEWVKLNRIPAVRLGRALRFDKQKIAEWLRTKGVHYDKKKSRLY
ncbi:MAG: helix-turn-helix domain-containing protein [Bdellovibrionaceae bacterium]|nr:helix-turn-helix domain-containing protein [Pseudobdellovibrionaceae bacterium]